jgi:hypothetical protein
MRKVVITASCTVAATALALALNQQVVSAHICDFLTGGGWIITTASGNHPPAKANFGVGGGCKHGSPTWGHLQYIDHGTGLNVHWTSITGYFEGETRGGERDPKRMGSRFICGTARTNQFGPVDFAVLAIDNGEPGVDDVFVIRLAKSGVHVYSTEGDADHTLGGDGPGGGNIALHMPNPSTTGAFGGRCAAFPELEG